MFNLFNNPNSKKARIEALVQEYSELTGLRLFDDIAAEVLYLGSLKRKNARIIKAKKLLEVLDNKESTTSELFVAEKELLKLSEKIDLSKLVIVPQERLDLFQEYIDKLSAIKY